MQIDFADFEPGKPLVIENYGKRMTITVEDLAPNNAQEIQEAVEHSYGPFTHVFDHMFKAKPNSTYVFGATEQEVKREVTPAAVPDKWEVEYIYWSREDEYERTYKYNGLSGIDSALADAKADFEFWTDRPLEIRVNGVVKYTWRKLWQQLTPLPEIGPNDQVVLMINPLDKV